MVFSSAVFLCLFLPAVTALYLMLPRGFRNGFLFAASLLFYAWGEPLYLFLMLFSIAFNYGCGLMLDRPSRSEGGRRTVLIAAIVVNIGLLGLFKYTDFALDSLNRLTGSAIPLLKLALPVGISFYTFQALSYTVDVYRRRVKAQRNFLDFGMYVSLFPQLIAGPIVRYTEIESQLKRRSLSPEQMAQGLVRFTAGLCKKVLLANQIGVLWDRISASAQTAPALTAWLGALAFTFQIYFDFSGYSDMAIGLGKLFGFAFPENFRYPYRAVSVTDFWRRWHITLSAWFREYVYIPLGGNRRGRGRQILNLFLVWLLTGLWHGAGVNFILWGLYFFAFLAAEKLFLGRLLQKLPRAVGWFCTMAVVVFSWVIFACDSPALLGSYAAALFGANGLADAQTLYLLRSFGALLVLCAAAASGQPLRLWRAVCARIPKNAGEAAELVASLGALAASFVFLISGTYNPFLYFRF